MYRVTTIITPIQYATKLNKALDHYNKGQSIQLTNLDSGILQALLEAKRGVCNGPLMLLVRNRMWPLRFNQSLARLVKLGFIVRTEYKNRVVYTITVSGKIALSGISDILAELCEQLNSA